jgi:hypothetical protein
LAYIKSESDDTLAECENSGLFAFPTRKSKQLEALESIHINKERGSTNSADFQKSNYGVNESTSHRQNDYELEEIPLPTGYNNITSSYLHPSQGIDHKLGKI